MRVFVSSKLPDLKSRYGSTDVVSLEDHGALVTCLSVDQDGHVVISGDENGVVCVRWSKGDDLFLSVVFQAHTGPITAMKFSNITKQFITGSIDGSARVWQSSKHEERVLPICQLHVGSGLISSVALSELNYVIGMSHGTVFIFGGSSTGRREEVSTPSLVKKIQHTRWPITNISSFTELEPAALWATVDDKGTIMIYNVVNSEEGGEWIWVPIAEHNLGAPPTVLDFLECSNIECPMLLTCTQNGSTLRLWKTNELLLDGPVPLLSPPQPVARRTEANSSIQSASSDHEEHGRGLFADDVESGNIPSPMSSSSTPSLHNNALDEDLLPLPFPPQPIVRSAVEFSVQAVAPSDREEHDKLPHHDLRTEGVDSSCDVSSPLLTSRLDSLENNGTFDIEGTNRDGRIPSQNSVQAVPAPLFSSLCNPMINSSARLTQAPPKLRCSQSDAVYMKENYKNIATASVNVDCNDVLYPNLPPIESPAANENKMKKKSTRPISSSKVVETLQVHLEPTDRTFTNIQPPAITESFQKLAKFSDPPFRDELDSFEQDYYIEHQ